jgi:hypothetical protein
MMKVMTDERRRDTSRKVENFRDVERQIVEHPAYLEYQECEALRRSIVDVFLPNLQELLELLEQAPLDRDLAFDLIQNMRKPTVRDRFSATLSRRMHNYLASTMSLVDHVRKIMRGRTGAIATQFSAKKIDLVGHPEVVFVQDLRNYTLHRQLPFFAHSLNLSNVNTPEQTMKSEVELSTHALLSWDGWSTRSRQFLEQAGEAVELRPLFRAHGALVSSLNIWLHNELTGANEGALEDLNRLVVRRNAALAGVDLATAERLTRQGLGSLVPGDEPL